MFASKKILFVRIVGLLGCISILAHYFLLKELLPLLPMGIDFLVLGLFFAWAIIPAYLLEVSEKDITKTIAS